MTANISDVESMSSMNESAWDMVDERSAASDYEENSEVSRFPTPMSEIPEPIYPESQSLAGNDDGSNSPDIQEAQNRETAQFSRSRKDSSSDPPDTARPLERAPERESILLEDQTSYIKFRESNQEQGQEVSFVLTEFDGSEKTRLAQDYNLGQKDEVAGTVRQCLSISGLQVPGPFKVVFAGPTQMKETIINKIASALATGPGHPTRDPMKSSRVTVVPISAFADDSSPDVVLIDSMGIDMNIEECRSAIEGEGNITLTMASSTSVHSYWDPVWQRYQLPEDYDIPHLAVIYVPAREHSRAKKLRIIAREFFTRHNIPLLLVSYDTKWQNSLSLSQVDERLPHLAIEAFNSDSGKSWILRRQAVDVNTFVSIDSAQLSRSLALLDMNPGATKVEDARSSKLIAETAFVPTLRKMQKRSTQESRTSSLLQLGFLAFLAIITILQPPLLFGHLNKPDPAFSSVVVENVVPVTNVAGTSTSLTYTTTISSIATSTITKTLKPASTSFSKSPVKVPVAELLKDSIIHNKSDSFQVQVVGDNHVLLFAPTWYKKTKPTPQLKIIVRRGTVPEVKLLPSKSCVVVPHEFSALHTGVFAFKFPAQHAHGNMVISISTSARPNSQEHFQVDLGSAWLKISRWQRAASALKTIVTEDIFAARAGLLETYSTTNERVQHFFKDAMVRADSLMKEAEKASLSSLSSTFQNTENLLAQTKAFTTSLTDRLKAAAGSRAPVKFSIDHESFIKDMSTYSKKISSMFVTQAKSLAKAASGISTIGEDIQAYRETHFVSEQRRLLQMYWNVFGMPDHLKTQLHEMQQTMIDEEVWGRGSKLSRKAARRARREAKRHQRRHSEHDED